LEWDLAVGIHEAVVADFHETGRQHMLQEAADELHDIESQDSLSFAVGLAITNAHGAVQDTDDARVGNGDFEDVGSELFESGLSGANGLAVNVPVDLPGSGWDLIEQFCLLHQIAELGAEDY
jgi:hypothetical protein